MASVAWRPQWRPWVDRGGGSGFGRACSELDAFGGVQSTYIVPHDEELAIAAHTVGEILEQREDLYSQIKRHCIRHGWIENDAALDVQSATAFARLGAAVEDASPSPLFSVSVDKQLSSLKDSQEQFKWALQQIRGSTFESIDTFHEHCYNLVDSTFLTAVEKVFLQTWTLLRRLPRSLVDTVAAAELMHIRSHRSAIELHALGICVGSAQLYAQEAMMRDQSKSRHAEARYSKLPVQARKLEMLDKVAHELLVSDVPSFFVTPGT